MDIELTDIGGWMGLAGSVLLMLVSYLGNKYLVPFLEVGKRQQYARFIAQIADEITDDLRARYPNREWPELLDEAVDTLIEVCDVSPTVAKRALGAAARRKQV